MRADGVWVTVVSHLSTFLLSFKESAKSLTAALAVVDEAKSALAIADDDLRARVRDAVTAEVVEPYEVRKRRERVPRPSVPFLQGRTNTLSFTHSSSSRPPSLPCSSTCATRRPTPGPWWRTPISSCCGTTARRAGAAGAAWRVRGLAAVRLLGGGKKGDEARGRSRQWPECVTESCVLLSTRLRSGGAAIEVQRTGPKVKMRSRARGGLVGTSEVRVGFGGDRGCPPPRPPPEHGLWAFCKRPGGWEGARGAVRESRVSGGSRGKKSGGGEARRPREGRPLFLLLSSSLLFSSLYSLIPTRPA